MESVSIKKIAGDFVFLFREVRGFEFGEGWSRPVYDMASEISMEAQRLGMDNQDPFTYPCISQIKEKFGELRVHIRNASPEMKLAAEMAMEKSKSTCEMCGLAGEIRRNTGWHHVACDPCEIKIVDERKAFSLGDK